MSDTTSITTKDTASSAKTLHALVRRKRLQGGGARPVKNTGYSTGGASRSKNAFINWDYKGGSTKEDIEVNIPILRQRSRDLFMNSPIARAALNRIQTNVVGAGLKLRVNPDTEALGLSAEQAKAWAADVEREWKLWAESRECDQLGLDTFDEIQQTALLSWLQSGDAFVLMPMDVIPWQPYDLRLHLIEADRVCDPSEKPKNRTIRQGVEISASGRVEAYWVKNTHPLTTGAENKWTRIPVRGELTGRYNILHLRVSERPEQYRGVPLLAPVIEACKQLSRYSEAELAAAVIASLYTVFVKSDTPQTPFGEPSDADVQAAATSEDSERDYNYSLGPGAVVSMDPDEDISIANPGRPNAQFASFIDAVSAELGAAINVPSELLMLKFTSSYSASRAALLEAWKGFRMWRAWMSADFCTPVYREWLTEAVLKGRVKAPGYLQDPVKMMAWSRCEWHGPAPGQVDPYKEVQAAKMRVEEGFSTRARETAELTGGDYDANVEQRAAEERQRKELGLISQEIGV